MAAVFKALAASEGDGDSDHDDDQQHGVSGMNGHAKSNKKNKQKVLILSSRGVTHRSVLQMITLQTEHWSLTRHLDTDTSSTTSMPSFLTLAKSPSSIRRRSSISSMSSQTSTPAITSSFSKPAKARIYMHGYPSLPMDPPSSFTSKTSTPWRSSTSAATASKALGHCSVSTPPSTPNHTSN
jgi:hypothetical protein